MNSCVSKSRITGPATQQQFSDGSRQHNAAKPALVMSNGQGLNQSRYGGATLGEHVTDPSLNPASKRPDPSRFKSFAPTGRWLSTRPEAARPSRREMRPRSFSRQGPSPCFMGQPTWRTGSRSQLPELHMDGSGWPPAPLPPPRWPTLLTTLFLSRRPPFRRDDPGHPAKRRGWNSRNRPTLPD